MSAAELFGNLPTASELREKVALEEAAKASAYLKRAQAAEDEKKGFAGSLVEPSGLSEEEKIERAAAVINRAVSNGLTEVQVFRFPNSLCTDRGRAINNSEVGWETTLTGLPEEIHQLWMTHLQPRGYHLRVQIVDYPNGMPGDVAMTLSWH